VAGAIPDLPDALLLRLASLTGRVRIRWDASRSDVVPAPRPDVDDEQARSQLLRRFLVWYGAVTPDRFARWAGITRDDATATWAALAPQLVAVSLAGAARWAHTDDLGALRSAPAVTGVRLLPMNDPHLHLAGEVDAAEPALDPAAPGPDVTQRLLNSLTGRILLDGRLVGGWGRAGADVTLDPWIPLGPAADAVEAEAVSFATPLGRPARVRWLRPPGGASPTTRRRRG
jgi:hypothetical protein